MGNVWPEENRFRKQHTKKRKSIAMPSPPYGLAVVVGACGSDATDLERGKTRETIITWPNVGTLQFDERCTGIAR